ncbi:MAG TPA: hypothetical protein VMT52_02495 [Planctomycetota bacterium]|nr:hypothetical protein [Planctomycetota bacterium]
MRGRSPRGPFPRLTLDAVASTVLLAFAGCIHLIEPIRPETLPLEDTSPFLAGRLVRAENGHVAPEIRRLRSEGLHHLDVDLRDWTARLLSELERELSLRGVTLIVPDSSLAATTSARPAHPARIPRGDEEAAAALRVWITGVRPPGPGGEAPLVSADLQEARTGASASFEAGEGRKNFSGALYDLKKKILKDERFRDWIGTEPAVRGSRYLDSTDLKMEEPRP